MKRVVKLSEFFSVGFFNFYLRQRFNC